MFSAFTQSWTSHTLRSLGELAEDVGMAEGFL